MAQQRYSLIEPDRHADLERILTQVSEYPRIRTSLEDVKQSWMDKGDSGTGMMRELAAPIPSAFRRLPNVALSRDPAMLDFGLIDDEDPVATMRVFGDGSGLALISDALPTIVFHLCRLNNMWLEPSRQGSFWRRRQRGAEARSDQRLLENQAVLLATVLLRYFITHMRVFGLAGKLDVCINEHDGSNALALATGALRFVMAHETAHFAFAHDSIRRPRGALPQALRSPPPLGTPTEWLAEFEADLAGVLSAITATQHEHGESSQSLTVLGARVALQCIELCEQALFVRRPKTHPPADKRWERVQMPASRLADRTVTGYLGGGLAAAKTAQRITETLPDAAWTGLIRSPLVSRETKTDAYLGMIRKLDDFIAKSPEEHHRFLATLQQDVDLESALRRINEQDPTSAFKELGLPLAETTRLTNGSLGLSFFDLHTTIASSQAMQAVDDTTLRTMFSMSFARLTADVLAAGAISHGCP